MRRLCLILMSISLFDACVEHGRNSESKPKPTSWQALVTGDQWSLLEPDLDPFFDQLGSRKTCGSLDFGPEYDGVEVSTKFCDYISLVQPLSFEIEKEDKLKLNLWHNLLISNDPSEGVISIQIADQELWSQRLIIPSPAYSWTFEIDSPQDFQTGDSVIFHVRNHGANSYTLNELSVARYEH